jgi:hypothetical protein
LIALAILKQYQRVTCQNRYIKKKNKFGKNSNGTHTVFIKLFPLKAYKNETSMGCNSR